jgi:hypothetical protein
LPASIDSIVHGLSLVIWVIGRQPWTIWQTPPWIFTTWPVTPAERSDASQPTAAATLDGSSAAFISSLGSPPPIRSSVSRVSATGAIALTRTPARSSSRPITMVSAAMPALAAA